MLGERIEEIRKARGLSRAQLAAAICSSERNISNYERGTRQPDAALLAALCDALDVSADYLLGLSDAPQPLRYAGGLAPDKLEDVAGICDRVFDLAALDAGAGYDRDALPVYAAVLDALRQLSADINATYAQIRDKYPAFTICDRSYLERAQISAAAKRGDAAALELSTGERAFENKLQNRIEQTSGDVFALLSEALFNVMRGKPGAKTPRLHRIITTGTDPGSSEQ